MKILSRLLLAALLPLALLAPVSAHEGHDHGAAVPAPAALPNAPPTLESDGTDVQLVALLVDGGLTLFIDRMADNSPITKAEVTLSADGAAPVTATPAADGTYRVPTPWAAKPGDHALNLTVTGEGVADLLVGTLTVPAPSTPVAGSSAVPSGLGLALGGFVLGAVLGAGVLAWRGRRLALAVLLLPLLLAGLPDSARAHEGHDHGPPAPEPVAGNNPRRLPDGSLFVPKSTQRLLAIRTSVLEPAQAAPVATLAGRVIADPNHAGRVNAPQSGRLMPPDGGFPLPGTRVKAGEVLAYIELLLKAENGSSISEQLASLDKDIRLARQQWDRVSNLPGAVPQKEIDDARATLDGLLRQRDAVARAVAKRVPLTAPVDGVITASNAVAGLMVEDRDVTVIFEIAEPSAVLVEALSFDGPMPAEARVTADIGERSVPLSLAGQGVANGGATRLLLRPDRAALGGPVPAIGTMLTLTVPVGAAVEGLLVPRDALVRGADGLPTVLVHEGAQRFTPRSVRTAPADAGHVRILDGVAAGARVVVQGATLLNQIR